MANGFTVEQEPFLSTQQTVFPSHMPQIAGTVEEFRRGDAFRDFQRDFPMRGGYFTWGARYHGGLLQDDDVCLIF